ncbi:iron-sulfur cluster carrier protein ApbC [Aquisalimonas asiatica]|uniref:Iron-sulfur cluster carrier protein n=1 Tax=Aquisalimonas asiatica TaxID=406100 RepID=A0A1H8R2S6_9GAMM|nr:iron-sulfur cluster carrier protein ApbC [Aquisalimonas asiatica]SEO60203.1 ATP-binding protein involved in chromosome partitioning [Aquisalimonas asiatica]
MSEVTRTDVEARLQAYTEPHLGKDLVAADCVEDIRVAGSRVAIDLVLGFPAKRWEPGLRQAVQETVLELDGVDEVQVGIRSAVETYGTQSGTSLVQGVKNIIAVASGKGGVGKSTTAVNLALALATEGARVGILDADIYGPSIPRMMGISGKPDSHDGKKLEPLQNYGVQVMSSGFLIDEETPMVWRGPMVTQALEQLLRDTNWQELDYLVVDMPPGTGDIQLTLSQKVPVSGAVIVTTPQDIALLDARKGLRMFEKVNVPVLGVIENMSTHICSQCGHEEHIFGDGGGARIAEQYEVDLLGSLPLSLHIREQADGGKPTVISEPDSAAAETYREMARRVGGKLSQQSTDKGSRFPKIVVNKES